MADNVFEDDTVRYLVLVNGEGQHSLWPHGAEVPAGWTVVHGPDDRQACLTHVEHHWTDMRPMSLRGTSEGQDHGAQDP